MDTDFFKHLEEVFPGRDIRAHNDEKLHNHGSSTIQHGRGSVLTVDLTNRCNMMCDPCFMDANQVGFVHELSWEDIKMVLDNAITIKPRRQMSVQFSGGEPTISPYFLDAVRYARKVGYNSVQAATNGIEFAKNPEFAKAGGRGRPALRVPAVRRHRQRGQRAPPRRQPVRRQAARDREPAQRRRRHRPGRDDRQRRQQRAGRPHHRVRARQPEEDQLPVVPAGVVHRPRRGSDAGAPRRAALHAVAPRARREEPDRHRRAGPRLVPDFVHGQLHRLGRRDARRREGVRPAHLRLPPELRRRHGDHDRQGNEGSGAGHGVPEGRAARQGRRSRSATPAAAASCRSSAWRSRSCATTTRSSRRRTSS